MRQLREWSIVDIVYPCYVRSKPTAGDASSMCRHLSVRHPTLLLQIHYRESRGAVPTRLSAIGRSPCGFESRKRGVPRAKERAARRPGRMNESEGEIKARATASNGITTHDPFRRRGGLSTRSAGERVRAAAGQERRARSE